MLRFESGARVKVEALPPLALEGYLGRALHRDLVYVNAEGLRRGLGLLDCVDCKVGHEAKVAYACRPLVFLWQIRV